MSCESHHISRWSLLTNRSDFVRGRDSTQSRSNAGFGRILDIAVMPFEKSNMLAAITSLQRRQDFQTGR